MADITLDRPKGKSLRPLRSLAPYLAPHWRVLAAALAALLVAAAAQLSLPIALRLLIDQGLAVRDAATINRYFIVLFWAPPSCSAASPRCASISSRGSASAWSPTCAARSTPRSSAWTRRSRGHARAKCCRGSRPTTARAVDSGVGSDPLRSAITLLGSSCFVATSPRLTLMIVLLMPLIVGSL
jgi:ATP-binding cassette subfamily B protein